MIEFSQDQEADVNDSNVVDIDSERMNRIYAIPPAVLGKLRGWKERELALMEGCCAGLGIDFSRYHADFDIDAGIIRLRPL